MKGVLDRFDDHGQAIILIEKEQTALVIPKRELPKGSKEGIWFQIKERNGNYEIVSIDHRTVKKEQKKSAEFIEKLRMKSEEHQTGK